jgi:ankyrin repeat protein
MKSSILILLLGFPLATSTRAADDLTAVLQQALFNEEADHDLTAAIKAYQSVVAGADAQRKLAATAVFRLGECYRKLGQTNEAVAQYQRILSDFTDQTNLVTLSRQNLTVLGANVERPRGKGMMGLTFNELLQLQAAQNQAGSRAEPTAAQVEAHRLLIERLELEIKTAEAEVTRSKELIRQNLVPANSAEKNEARLLDLRRQLILAQDAGPAGTADGAGSAGPPLQNLSPAARAQLKELLEGEIAVASQLLEEQRKKVASGVIASDETWRFERDVLGLKRQLLAVDGLVSAEDRKKWREMLLEETALAEKAVQIERKKLDTGRAVPGELAKLQRDVFALKRELVTFDAAPSASASSSAPREVAATDEEEKEVRRIQALIKDSPDLVNAKNVVVGMTGDRARYGTPLHKAAQQGQLVVTRFLIDNNADLDSRDGFGRTALHWAALNGHKSMAELLLAKGADPNASISASAGVGSAGQTPLHFAAQNGYRNVCEALLAGKADLNAKDSYEQTPLHLAADRGFSSVAELLLTRGANANSGIPSGTTPLHNAAGSGSKRMVELLLANKADINAQNAQGGTPLQWAVNGKHADVVRLLLANKANPNLTLNEKAPNSAGWTPLVTAISQDDVPMARLLLENGADPNAFWSRNGDWTVLMQAVQKGSLELVEALVAAGAEVNARSGGNTRATALYFATSINPTNAAAIVELLLKNKAEVNVADANGYTPLIQAVIKRNLDVAKLLVERGADVNAMTRDGESPLSLIKPRRQQGYGLAAPFGNARIPGPIPSSRSITRVGGVGVPGQPDQPPPDPTSEIIALLERRGARDDLRRLSALSTSRNQEDRRGWLFKGTNDWNHFTLLELIAWINPRSGSGSQLDFPDLSRLAIGRIDPITAKTEDFRIDLSTVLTNSDCAKDLPLQWGDVVDIPEQDHFVDVGWDRFPDAYYEAFQKCLQRTVRVTVKGQTSSVTLTPFRMKAGLRIPGGSNPWEPRMGNFRLNRFLRNSGLLLTSSDVTRVKVKRADPATKQVQERIFNLDQINNTNDDANDLWLNDGDVIEVPEKGGNQAAAAARAGASAEAYAVQLNFEPIVQPIEAAPIQLQFTLLPSNE